MGKLSRFTGALTRFRGLGRLTRFAGAFGPIVSKIAPYAQFVPGASKFAIAANMMMGKVTGDGGAVMNMMGDGNGPFSKIRGIVSKFRGSFDKVNRVRDMVRSKGGGILGKLQGIMGGLGGMTDGADPLTGILLLLPLFLLFLCCCRC